MAGGGKETPRQKMVGMMYLVLTALLALQVSNAVLDKFQFIDESLEHAVSVTREGNDRLIEGIKKKVTDQGSRANDVAILTRAETTKKLTSDIIHQIDQYRDEIIKATGPKDEHGKYPGAKDYDKPMLIMIGPEGSKSGKGYELEKKFDEYAKALEKMDSTLRLGNVTPEAKEMKEFKNNPDQNTKDWVELNFDRSCLGCIEPNESRNFSS
jgi:gliding motility-associated protein GldM